MQNKSEQESAPVPVVNVDNKVRYNYAKCDSTVYVVKSTIYSIFHTLMAFFACYLSYKCNGGFHTSSFLLAIFFPYIYIIYD